MKRIFLPLAALILMVGLLSAGCTPSPSIISPTTTQKSSPELTTTATNISWRLSSLSPKEFWLSQVLIWWSEEINKETQGQLTVEFYPSGVITSKAAEALTFVDSGIVEAAPIPFSAVSGSLKSVDVLSLPGLMPADLDKRGEILKSIFPEFKKMFEDNYNVYVQCILQADPRNIYSRPDVPRLADLEGMKIRASGSVETNFVNALGGTATSVSATEMYTALQQGIVDGIGIPESAVISYRINEQAKHIIPLAWGGGAQVIVVNKDSFDTLPEDIQKAIINLQPQLQQRFQDAMATALDDARQELLSLGMTVVEWPEEDISEVNRRGEATWQEWLKNAGPDGQELINKIQVLRK